MTANKSDAVLVIGAGVAGIKASLDLVEAGLKVYLCDQKQTAGGILLQLDKWFPDNACGLCRILPSYSCNNSGQFCLRRGLFHPGINYLSATNVENIEGNAGNFKVTLNKLFTGVDSELCNGCGKCTEVCPVIKPDYFNRSLKEQRAVFVEQPYGASQFYRIDWEKCTRCGKCVEICPVKAINLEIKDSIQKIDVGAVVLSTGFDEFEPCTYSQYGYKRYRDVITGFELERILSPGGPSEGSLRRPSDGKIPKSVAFLQCVGSRDSHRGYCSSACCMYSLKEATMIKQAYPETDVQIFFMDMRAFGKDYHRYYREAREKYGVKFVRCRVPVIKRVPRTGDLLLDTTDSGGKLVKSSFDLVVLSVGQNPSSGFKELCASIGVATNKWGFCRTEPLSPVDTSRQGIYACGSAVSPKDISDTVIEAGAAAARAACGLTPDIVVPDVVNSINKLEEEPKIAVIICRCDETDGSQDFSRLADSVKKSGGVDLVLETHEIRRQDTLKLKTQLKQNKINRLVIAASASYFKSTLFLEILSELDINDANVYRVNLRETLGYIHHGNPGGAVAKAEKIIAMAVEQARAQENYPLISSPVTRRALVIGGGLAGMIAALRIAASGNEVYLVEKTSGIGGNFKDNQTTLEGGNIAALFSNLEQKIHINERIHLNLKSELEAISGYAGNFNVKIRQDNKISTLDVGAVVIATGGSENRPAEYMLGHNPGVMTQHNLEEKISSENINYKELNRVVMIQCVDSRNETHPYCSRICCSQALKNAIKLKQENPDIEIFIIYRDLMSYGFKEEYYTEARNRGIVFLRYELENKPVVTCRENRLRIELDDLVLGGKMALEPDLLVLSTGILPADNLALSDKLGLKLDKYGFYREAEPKFRPLDFLKEGMFVCGLAQSPRSIDETIVQAEGAAGRVNALLRKTAITPGKNVSEIVQRRCARCEMCITICPYGARIKDEENNQVRVIEALCHGCGACTVVCPSQAAKLRGFKNALVFSMIDTAI